MSKNRQNIFREYDIRGIVGDDIDAQTVLAIGRSYGAAAREKGAKKVAVGRDCRPSSEDFSAALTEGIISEGVGVVDIGLVSTPMMYFSIFNMDLGGGAIVTASHNPPQYNGLKLCMGKSAMFGNDIRALAHAPESKPSSVCGSVETADIGERYADFLCGGVSVESGIEFAYDCGNGTGGIAAPLVFEKLGLKADGIFTEPDGTFPNHHPDPSVEENLADLINAVRGGDALFGMAFDGDADRLGVVDGAGAVVRGDMLTLIFALDICSRKRGAKIIGDVKCSGTLFDLARSAGAEAIMWKTGHSLMKKKLADENADLAGEMSGHIFFGDRFPGYDDALYAGLRLLEIVSKTGKGPSELLADVPAVFSTPELRVDCADEQKFAVVEEVKKLIAEKFPQAEICDIDGVRAGFGDGWGLVRASNTQPALVLRFEAESEERLREIKNAVEGIVAEAQEK